MKPLFLHIKHLLGSTAVDVAAATDADGNACFPYVDVVVVVAVSVSVVVVVADNLIDFRVPCSFAFC